MRKVKQVGLIMLMGISTVMINGCAKDGATGPAGANGISGTNGTQGTAGTNGTNGTAGTNGTNGTNGSVGATGNANVQASNFTVTTWTLSGNSQYWYYDYSLAINSNAAVMVYLSQSGAYLALPFTVQDNEIYFSNTTAHLEVAVTSASGTTAISNPGTTSFKVVIIPPGIKVLHPNTNWQNYSEVKSILNLPD